MKEIASTQTTTFSGVNAQFVTDVCLFVNASSFEAKLEKNNNTNNTLRDETSSSSLFNFPVIVVGSELCSGCDLRTMRGHDQNSSLL